MFRFLKKRKPIDRQLLNNTSEKSNTGFKGITMIKDGTKFQAQVTVVKNGETINLHTRRVDSLEEAIAVRENYIKSLF